MKTSQSLTLLIIITLFISGVIAYFGYRTIEHEALLRQYQVQSLAQSHTTQINFFIIELLNKKAVRFNSMANFIVLDDLTLSTLINKDTDIEALFVLNKNQLQYPDELNLQSQRELAWIQAITPIIHDPSLLYSHYFTDEQSSPQSGWFISNATNEPLLIYWLIKDQSTIGFKVSYIKLLSDVINSLDLDYSPDAFSVKENGRLLYQSGSQNLINSQTPIVSRRLAYPLTAWQIDYYAQTANSSALYLWGGLIILLLISTIGLIIFRLYREYTQNLRLANQQVSFVGQVSHELKTPLTNITLYAEMLKEEQLELAEQPDPTEGYLDVVISESQRLSRLIQNILSFTKAPKIHLQPVDLRRLLNQIHQTFIPAFNAKGISLELVMSENINIESDIDRLTQIINNFLSNAEKYASHGQRVELSALRDADAVYICVRDYGNGIAPKELKAIFQPFYRVKSTITEGVSGTGIGLTIAKQLAESLPAEILVENQSPGVCFSLKLLNR